MSLLSNFVMNHVVSALEAELSSHLPELQQEFLNEISSIVKEVSLWIESKLPAKGEAIDGQKTS